LVDVVLAGLGAPSVDALVAVHESWATIVGEELVAHAHPIAIEAGCLRIGVDSPAWASHLRWSEHELMARAERVVGPGVVTSVSTRVVRPGARA
jgi:predicted nucleic acid-binding Zn ribbon protein